MTVVIVGGGWSGLAAAITLTDHGIPVHVVESAKQLGGRARNVSWQDKVIDNGQHLMIGAYDHMLALMSLIDIDHSKPFKRYPIDITIVDDIFTPLHISAKGGLPWPLSLAWNVFCSAGLSAVVQLVRLQRDIPKLLANDDMSVANWLHKTRQSQRLIKQLWQPLCLATLNTPIANASAHVLAHVLKDSLGQHQTAADLLIPQQPLGTLFPQPAATFLTKNGGKITLGCRVKELINDNGQIKGISTNDGNTYLANHVIIATGPSQCADLLSPMLAMTQPDQLPICTVYLQYGQEVRLPAPMLGLSGTHSQWIFDRSLQHPGLMAVVISGPGQHENRSKQALIECVSAEIHQLIPSLPAQAQSACVIREKRATFASTIAYQQQRPTHKTSTRGLWLAGDFVANNYPATLEGAIRNGEKCAHAILAEIS
ncbi:MAG: hydroxysqualene dehydroxylase HpnE [Gammaproteobacteria bacterium]|nr:hydroxysqualene dehydroxylase HpnE [Gammaproteobacteria bacterium]